MPSLIHTHTYYIHTIYSLLFQTIFSRGGKQRTTTQEGIKRGKNIWIQHVVCVCFLPIHSGHQWTYQPGSHRRKVTQDFSSQLLSAVHAFIFLARRIQPFLSLVDREVDFFCVLTIKSFSTRWAFLFLFFSFLVRKIPFAGIELTS